MRKKVQSFATLSAGDWAEAGGKGGTLARLYQAGYPVPDGFVVLPTAFVGEEMSQEAWQEVQAHLARMRNGARNLPFAVRSSALSEDSAVASFAGEFETVLNVHSDEMIREAIHSVRRSRSSERVQAYTRAKGMEQEHEVAVVVQRLVQAEISGILFTADPVSGSHLSMSGNFIFGLGDELVSGEVEPYTFTISRPKGAYTGPPALKRHARRLFKTAVRLEKELGQPQDIEWCVAGGRLYVLQSRPITTLMPFDPATGLWNSSLGGDYLWFQHEVFSDVLTASSWSIWQSFHQFNIGGAPGVGNIGGRVYMNYSIVRALMMTFGSSEEAIADQMVLTAGRVPPEITVPPFPQTRWGLIKLMIPIMAKLLPRQMRLARQFDAVVDRVPGWCQEQRQVIRTAPSRGHLAALWHDSILPMFDDLTQLQDRTNEDYFNPYKALKKELTRLVGDKKALGMLSSLTAGSAELSSMAALVGLARLHAGEMSRQEYMALAGHRPPRENELSEPRPYEDPDWLERQLAEYAAHPVDVEGMVARSEAESAAVWRELERHYPRPARKLARKAGEVTAAMYKRERSRSELTRVLGVMRDWFLRAGELTGVGGDIFFLSYQEALEALDGNEVVVATIPARRAMHEKLCALPRYPAFISGRFDPFQWAADPQRRSDFFDSHGQVTVAYGESITGYPGSAGRVEGLVRHLADPTQGHQLQEGEILLASTTNVGWTPVFPRAAAVITDIGAPLSHAAIVARELGIPAVVGTGNATMRLRTGDRVRVDGSRGVVEILQAS